MNELQILIVTIGVVITVGLVLGVLLPYLKRRGVDVQKLLDQSKEVLAAANSAYDIVKPFIKDSVDTDKFDKVVKVANVGMQNVQQLYDSGQMTDPDERKAAARQYSIDALTLIGIDVTPEVLRVVDGAIESNIYLKNKGNEDQVLLSE